MNNQSVIFLSTIVFLKSIFLPASPGLAQMTGYASGHVEKKLTAEEEIQKYKRYIEQLGLVNNPELRDKARSALLFIREEAFPCLYQALKGNPTPLVRSGVVDIIADIGKEDSVPKVLKCFQKEMDLKVRIAYIKCLSRIGVQNPSVVKALLRLVKTERNEKILVSAVEGLRWAAGEKKQTFTPPPQDNSREHRAMAGTALIEMLRSPSTTEFVKIYAVKAIGELKEFRAIPDLAILLDPTDMGIGPLQLVAMEALKTIGTPAAVQVLIDCLDHPRKEVSEDAVISLGSLNTGALDALITVLNDRSKSPLSRGGVAEALALMNDFGKTPIEKTVNVGKIYKSLQTAQIDLDQYVAKKASEAMECLKEKNGFKKSTGKAI